MKQLLLILLFTFFATLIFAQKDKSKFFVLGVIDEIQSKELAEKEF
ncbi:hypothetical protein [Ferruginibacter sp.]